MFLSPPVHIARWAHMHRFLPVQPSVRHWIMIHISKSIIAINLKIYHNILRLHHTKCPYVLLVTYCTLRKKSYQQMSKAPLLWQVELIANVKLHFLSSSPTIGTNLSYISFWYSQDTKYLNISYFCLNFSFLKTSKILRWNVDYMVQPSGDVNYLCPHYFAV